MLIVCGEANELPEQRCATLLATVGDALYAVGGKWTLRVIIALAHGTKRFNELQRTVKGISARVLSNELKELELNGFVKRTVYADSMPVIVEYALTEYSDTLEHVVHSLSEWGARHRLKIRGHEIAVDKSEQSDLSENVLTETQPFTTSERL